MRGRDAVEATRVLREAARGTEEADGESCAITKSAICDGRWWVVLIAAEESAICRRRWWWMAAEGEVAAKAAVVDV